MVGRAKQKLQQSLEDPQPQRRENKPLAGERDQNCSHHRSAIPKSTSAVHVERCDQIGGPPTSSPRQGHVAAKWSSKFRCLPDGDRLFRFHSRLLCL